MRTRLQTITATGSGWAGVALILWLSWIGVLTGCVGEGRTPPASSRPVLRVGTSGDYAPFSLEGQGFDVEVAERFAATQGYTIEWVTFRWPELAADVAAGRFDVAMSGVTWRPDRAVVGYMTRAVALGGPCVLGAVAGRRVAVNRGGVLERFARAELSDRELRTVDRNLELPALLARGEVDAIVTDSFELASFRARLASLGREQVEVACRAPRGRKVYWVAPQRAGDLGPALDRWLAAHEAELQELRTTWLGQPFGWGPRAHAVDLIGRRLELMPFVGRWKRARGLGIEDAEREARVLDAVARQARSLGLAEPPVRALFEAQIEVAKQIQMRVLESGAPSAAEAGLDLDLRRELRPLLIALGDRILGAIGDCAAAPPAPERLDPGLDPGDWALARGLWVPPLEEPEARRLAQILEPLLEGGAAAGAAPLRRSATGPGATRPAARAGPIPSVFP